MSTLHPRTILPVHAPLLSIVVPAFEEEGNLGALHRKIMEVLDEGVTPDWELLFVDDGSRDGTWQEILRLHAHDPRVCGLSFSRNFGHQRALLAGLEHARGAAVITMDADLQHPPSLIPALVDAWETGNQIVHTVRKDSKGVSWLKRATSRGFYRVYSLLSGVSMEPGMADFRLLDRSVVDQLIRFEEQGLFLRGLFSWMGFRNTRVEFECGTRYSGTTKYSPRRMLSLAWSGVTSFSLVPLRMATLVGLLTSGLAFGFLIYALVAELGGYPTVPGWASGVSIVSFLFGVLFILLGVIGEYLGKVLTEVKRRPRYLVQEYAGSAGPERHPLSGTTLSPDGESLPRGRTPGVGSRDGRPTPRQAATTPARVDS